MAYLSPAELWMTILTSIMVFANVALFAVTYRLWSHAVETARDQSKLTRDSNETAILAARAAEISAESSVRSIELSLRPHVVPVVQPEWPPRKDNEIRISFRIKNFGKTPGLEVAVKLLYDVRRADDVDAFLSMLAVMPAEPTVALAPGEFYFRTIRWGLENPISGIQDYSFYAICEVSYSSVFGRRHMSRVGAKLRLHPDEVDQSWKVVPYISHHA